MWKEWAGRASYGCVAKAQLLHSYGYGGLEQPSVWELSTQESNGMVRSHHTVAKLSPFSDVCLYVGGWPLGENREKAEVGERGKLVHVYLGRRLKTFGSWGEADRQVVTTSVSDPFAFRDSEG